jgi:hypothetical protein
MLVGSRLHQMIEVRLSHIHKTYYFLANRALAETAYEDTYLTILDVDGSEWADNLRAKMQPSQEGPLQTEQSWLMDHIMV